MKHLSVLLSVLVITSASVASAKKTTKEETAGAKPDLMSSETFAGLALRSIGPAIASGRICDFAVDPSNPSHFFVAVCSGGVWKTTNAGTTWSPVFDGEGSYSVGCIALDPTNPDVVWVGSGENNSQRSVSFGDGVYKSLDGGASWKNMGLKGSEHSGMIAIDPRNPDVVYVAAQGPLWRSGGERGLYKTTDGGVTWTRVLEISEHTGVNEVHLDPRNPDVVYASAYQRQRRVWTLIDGGPESAIYKSTDAGATWRKVGKGLPEVDLGRIGMCIAPANPDVVYAIVEAAQGKAGFFRSTDRGESWEKRSDHDGGSAQYYNEIVCDPKEVDRVYSLETWMHVTEDGGKTFKKTGSAFRHVDDHAMWINPTNTDHLLVGCDGGVYESFDRGVTYEFKANLPVTQFYRLGLDNAEPFYYVYGGTQDNATLGGPSRTRFSNGIANEDWFVTVFGDGFQTRVDPEDPSIVYSEWQYGGLARYDRRSGEIVSIRPQEAPGEEPYRWNWDAPLIISPHSHTRLYFAAQKLFCSDDRGNSWRAISDDLSRGIDRNSLKVMGKVWGADAVAKSDSTSVYGNAVALTESPVVEGLLYVGTDDGRVLVTEDGGASWWVVDSFPGIPELTYVSRLEASLHDASTVFAAFDAHKDADFKPYLLKSKDRGETWTSIVGDLPERGMVWAIAEDHVDPNLLFAGTEYGVYFTRDGGQHWIQLKGGMPTIAVRDLAIQRRENDLVLATFGRGFYILDDYSALRTATREQLEKTATLFPVKDALTYVETSRLGLSLVKAFQGDAFYTAPNPPFGAVFTYYLKDGLKTRAEQRREAEKEADKKGTVSPYPSKDELRAEAQERDPQIILVVKDANGDVVKRITGPRTKGFQRVAWDLRYPPLTPVSLEKTEPDPWETPPNGPMARPGTYTVNLLEEVNGRVTNLAGPVSFEVNPLDLATFRAEDRDAVLAFNRKAADLQRAVHGALKAAGEAKDRIAHLRKAVVDTPVVDAALLDELERVQADLEKSLIALRGDVALRKRNEATPTSIKERVDAIVETQWYATSAPTQNHRDAYAWAGEAFAAELERLRGIDARLENLESAIEAASGPWTPGRLPEWKMH